jgi:CBS domain-containing protein
MAMTQLTAKDLMSANVITAGVGWSVQRLAETLLSNSISGTPVIDDDGKLVGVVSITDVTRAQLASDGSNNPAEIPDYYQQALERQFGDEGLSSMSVSFEPEATVGDIMTPVVFSVADNEPVQRVAATMLNGHIHRVCVTRDGELVGVLSAFDMLRVVRDL